MKTANFFNKEITINVKEYRLMYFFGAWITKAIIPAESDREAIFDAHETAASMKDWKYGVALFCGNRMVKEYIHNQVYQQ